jgi:hypothetical protein
VGGPFDEFEAALRRQVAAAEPGSGLGTALETALDGGRLPIVFPAHVVVAPGAGRVPEPGASPAGREWLVAELERAYGGRPAAAWRAAVDTDRVAVIVLDEPGFDPPPLTELGAPVTRVALPAGHTARHVRSPWPAWVRVVTFALAGLSSGVLAWSYDISAWVAVALGAVIGSVFARLGPYPPLRLWRFADIGSWTSFRRLAVQSSLLFAAVALAIGLLAIDGLTGRDAALVMVPLLACGAWMGGGDLVAVMAHHGRGRTVADLGATRVLARSGPFAG